MAILTLALAKDQLRITDDRHDADITAKLEAAEGVILEYLGEDADPAWDSSTVPKAVETAILRYLSHLYEDRTGRASDGDKPAAADVWADLRLILARRRQQAIGVGLAEDPEVWP